MTISLDGKTEDSVVRLFRNATLPPDEKKAPLTDYDRSMVMVLRGRQPVYIAGVLNTFGLLSSDEVRRTKQTWALKDYVDGLPDESRQCTHENYTFYEEPEEGFLCHDCGEWREFGFNNATTLTIERGDEALTVEVVAGKHLIALDEQGFPVQLTPFELAEVFERWVAGEDETGR